MLASVFYGQACTRKPHFSQIILMVALIAALFVPKLGAQRLDFILLGVLIGLLVMDWGMAMVVGAPIRQSFPDIDIRTLMTYGALTALLSIGMMVASGWLFGSTLIRVFDEESKGSVIIRSVRCSLAVILLATVFFHSIIPAFMDNDMGSVSSIHRIMFEIHQTPASKDKMLEHLLCSRIPILTRKGRDYMTREAARILLDKKYNKIIPAATIKEYNEWIKGKTCPVGSEAGANNPYPLMMPDN
ncbi:hypothetical protein EBZ35_08975 [bacterium]|nr:hypothetical protein [bacterium]